jgi:hypothetical protein
MCGTVTSVIAFMKFMILPGAPARSASVPIWNPGVSTSITNGMLNESHITMKSTILRQASPSSAPPRCNGLLAMMPTALAAEASQRGNGALAEARLDFEQRVLVDDALDTRFMS